MNKYLLILLLGIMTISCTKDKTFSEELVGVWVYERETFNENGNFFFNFDVSGTIEFKADKKGIWDISTSPGDDEFLLKWQINSNNDKMVLSKKFNNEFFTDYDMRVYTLKRMDENNFTITYINEGYNDVDEDLVVLEFENIILTRIS